MTINDAGSMTARIVLALLYRLDAVRLSPEDCIAEAYRRQSRNRCGEMRGG
jgi:hypothetical protein